MLTGADIQKRIKMSNADCIIADVNTALKIDNDVDTCLKNKILVESDNSNDQEKDSIEKMESKGNNKIIECKLNYSNSIISRK